MVTIDFVQIGRNIVKIMIDKGISQQQLVDAVGISEHVMCNIIAGHKVLNMRELTKFALALGVDVNELVVENNESVLLEEPLGCFDGIVDDVVKQKFGLIRQAIDEIHMLETVLC